MKGILLLLGLVAHTAHAADLVCDAETSSPAMPRISTTISIDPSNGAASMFTVDGVAKGALKMTDEAYMGELVSSSGDRLWLYVDRYRGSFSLTKTPYISGSKALMWGECRQATQRF